MFSRKDIDHGFIEQPLWFGQFFTHTRKPITTETLKVASRTNGKRFGAEMPIQIRLLMYTNTRTTQSNFLSLRCFFFFWWTWNLSYVNGQGQRKSVINSGKRLSRGHLWRLSTAVNATLRVDFHCCVKLTRVNKIETMHERPRVNVRIERLNFYVYVRHSIYCLYFVYARKNYATVEILHNRVVAVINPCFVPLLRSTYQDRPF